MGPRTLLYTPRLHPLSGRGWRWQVDVDEPALLASVAQWLQSESECTLHPAAIFTATALDTHPGAGLRLAREVLPDWRILKLEVHSQNSYALAPPSPAAATRVVKSNQ